MPPSAEPEQRAHQLKTIWAMCKGAVAQCQTLGFENDDLARIIGVPQQLLEELLRLWGLG